MSPSFKSVIDLIWHLSIIKIQKIKFEEIQEPEDFYIISDNTPKIIIIVI